MERANFIKEVYSKKSGSVRYRIAEYLNEYFNRKEYCVEKRTKFGYRQVGSLSSFYMEDAIRMLERCF